ncbi:RtcB family protein [Methanimicrococcus blatticola]|uniref:tRNA-splicing ligase RtcB n=1 Tax=Methanimicrococcus blatticola TaxID=91560 RepID=A0A484F605_9EURY|nr:RtcB family protein [Methanimicrococcus blatticola]MBZ3936323.1 RtcB family protein [Methanimicrococcus blatticola]TDQ70219.1 tRNA-splicing ligase RtcB [Methanimicrococcus blatticola]
MSNQNKEKNESDVTEELTRVNDNIWDIPTSHAYGMNVPGRLFLSEKLMGTIDKETVNQVANVAMLPGILDYSMAMPDVHLGYGFTIGGVAAFDEEEGVISPGGVGFDINCGVRLMKTNLLKEDATPHMKILTENLFKKIPSGVGSKGEFKVTDTELTEAFLHGSQWAVEAGYGIESDTKNCESYGFMEGGNPDTVGTKARKRGRPQFGTLGSGNHFLEIQYVDKIYDPVAAAAYGLEEGQVTVMIHCGSRGAGHQICTDHLQTLNQAVKKYKINVPDMQLACAPAKSKEAQDYFDAMKCGANYAWANRQIIMHWTREVFEQFYGKDTDALGMELLYDVAHNVAKYETHEVDGKKQDVYVHRKGATRAFPAGHPEVPQQYRDVGQPVLIPGSMGTPSFVLKGGPNSMSLSFGSACHGAGRLMGRGKAKGSMNGEAIQEELARQGITVRAEKASVIAEEAPSVYKNSDDVVDVVDSLGIAQKVARLIPIGVIKG